MRLTRMSIELATLLYLATYVPYMLITRGLSVRMHPFPMQFQTSVLAFAICLPTSKMSTVIACRPRA